MRVSGGDARKVAVDLHSAVNFPQLLATAIERENVPICVRTVETTLGGFKSALLYICLGWATTIAMANR